MSLDSFGSANVTDESIVDAFVHSMVALVEILTTMTMITIAMIGSVVDSEDLALIAIAVDETVTFDRTLYCRHRCLLTRHSLDMLPTFSNSLSLPPLVSFCKLLFVRAPRRPTSRRQLLTPHRMMHSDFDLLLLTVYHERRAHTQTPVLLVHLDLFSSFYVVVLVFSLPLPMQTICWLSMVTHSVVLAMDVSMDLTYFRAGHCHRCPRWLFRFRSAFPCNAVTDLWSDYS